MLAGTLGVCIYYIAVGWITHSRPTYMSAGMLGACIHFMVVGWISHSGHTYMSAGMLGAPIYPSLHAWSAHDNIWAQGLYVASRYYLGQDWLEHYMWAFDTDEKMLVT